jgi:protein MpaA
MRFRVGEHRRWMLIGAAAVGVAVFALIDRPGSDPDPRGATAGVAARPAASPRGKRTADPLVHRRVYLGRSVGGRPLYAVELGDPDNPRRTLAVGVIHGNEGAGRTVTRRLASGKPPKEALLWLVNDLNPDGLAAGTRQNAHGVDLNRNFPFRWRRLGSRGDLHYSGPRPLSEPESRVARKLILRVRPRTTIWFHQALDLVDRSGGRVAVERRFARLVGLPLERLTRYPGSAVGWQNHRLPNSTAFVVELPPGAMSAGAASRYAGAVLALASPSQGA